MLLSNSVFGHYCKTLMPSKVADRWLAADFLNMVPKIICLEASTNQKCSALKVPVPVKYYALRDGLMSLELTPDPGPCRETWLKLCIFWGLLSAAYWYTFCIYLSRMLLLNSNQWTASATMSLSVFPIVFGRHLYQVSRGMRYIWLSRQGSIHLLIKHSVETHWLQC